MLWIRGPPLSPDSTFAFLSITLEDFEMKNFVLSLLVVFCLVGFAQAQTVVPPDAPHTVLLSDEGGQTTYTNVGTAKVVAVGGFVDPVNIKMAVEQDTELLVAGLYTPRKAMLHKMEGDDKGPEKAWLWVRLAADNPWGTSVVDDCGRGRFKTIVVPFPVFENRRASNGAFVNNCLAVVLIPDTAPVVTLMCMDCGEVYTEVPVLDKDGNLLNSICPVCGGMAITSDTLTPEVATAN